MKQAFGILVCDLFFIFMTDRQRLKEASRTRHGEVGIVDGVQDSFSTNYRMNKLKMRQVHHAARGNVHMLFERACD